MNSSRVLKSAALILLSLSYCAIATAAQDPCASNTANAKCAQAIQNPHQRVTGAGAKTDATAAAQAAQPLADTPPADSVAQEDRLHTGEAHPVAARHERTSH